jgi:hypothetical protein
LGETTDTDRKVLSPKPESALGAISQASGQEVGVEVGVVEVVGVSVTTGVGVVVGVCVGVVRGTEACIPNTTGRARSTCGANSDPSGRLTLAALPVEVTRTPIANTSSRSKPEARQIVVGLMVPIIFPPL